jgi:hypothetical protein
VGDSRRSARGPFLLALTLALVAVLAAVRPLVAPSAAPSPAPGAYGTDETRARALVAGYLRGLLAVQGADGAFDPWPDDPNQALVRRTGAHALATLALARARGLGLDADLPELAGALDRALEVLRGRQQPGGNFGNLDPGQRNPWPGVDALSAGVLALAVGGRTADQPALGHAAGALGRALAYEPRDGWTRALAMIAVRTLLDRGERGLLAADVATLVRVDESEARVDCTDYRLAEAVSRRVRGAGRDYAGAVLGSCLAEQPRWNGDTTDLQALWLEAWLAARLDGSGTFFPALLGVLSEAARAAPGGLLPAGWYADGITRTACAVLALAEGLTGGAETP